MRRRRSGGPRLLLALLLFNVTVAGGLAGVAEAEQPDPAPDRGIHVAPNPAAANVSGEILKAMQRDLKVTAEQAKARLVRVDWATRLDAQLEQRLGNAYGRNARPAWPPACV